MKHISSLLITIILLLTFSTSAQQKVPPELHGYWQFKADKQGDWNGLHIGENYLEIEYDLIAVDSVRQSGNDYTVYLTHDKAGKFSIDIKLHAKDSALINFELGRMKFDCKRFDRNPSFYSPMPADKDKYAFYGNWYEPIKNDWTYGFFEKFAIFDGKFWEYKAQTIKKNKASFTLQNGNESLELTLKKTNDSTLKIASGKQKAINYKKADRTLPHYKTVDTTRFADNQFARIDTAYITGYLRNRTNTKPFEISLTDMIMEEQVSYFGDVDSLGRFQIKVPLYNTSMVFMDWRVMHQMVVLEPNEKYFLLYDSSTKQTLFMGKNVRINNEFAAFSFFDIPRTNRQEGITALDFLALKEEGYKKANEYVNTVFKKMPNPSYKLRYFLLNYNRSDMAFDLMQYRFNLDRKNQEKLPDEYMAYIHDTILSNPPLPITLNGHFLSFIRDYIGYSQDIKGNLALSSIEVLFSMVENNQLKLDEADRNVVTLIANSYLKITNHSDTIQVKQFTSELKENDTKRFGEIYQQNIEQINIETSRMFSEMRMKSELEALDAVIFDKNIRDYYAASILYKHLNNNRAPIEDEFFNTMISQVQTPIFRDKVLATQKFYTELSGKSLEHTASLKNTSHLKEAKDADALWNELISPYKGKIIYADFWGTWCGPCKREMEYVADLKKQFVGKDIVFMYFANNSPEESWKNVIKSYSLTGENVVQYRLPDEQQGMLERRFGIRSFPTYMTIDRNGNVVDSKPPRPSQKDNTVHYLNSWLEK